MTHCLGMVMFSLTWSPMSCPSNFWYRNSDTAFSFTWQSNNKDNLSLLNSNWDFEQFTAKRGREKERGREGEGERKRGRRERERGGEKAHGKHLHGVLHAVKGGGLPHKVD